jgi:hypothetical protein
MADRLTDELDGTYCPLFFKITVCILCSQENIDANNMMHRLLSSVLQSIASEVVAWQSLSKEQTTSVTLSFLAAYQQNNAQKKAILKVTHSPQDELLFLFLSLNPHFVFSYFDVRCHNLSFFLIDQCCLYNSFC